MRFVCDAMLGKLAKYLRILGLDTVYIKNMNELRCCAPLDYQFFFTKRSRFKDIDRAVFIRSDKAMDQVKEIRDIIRPYVDLKKAITRCIKCNTPLADIKRIDVEHYVPEFVFHQYERFSICPLCLNIYWEGSHAAHMARFVEEAFG
jgi:uncharacterized protein